MINESKVSKRKYGSKCLEKKQKILDFVENSNFIWESIKAAVRGYFGENS